ncbi:MAG: apolipoprotein N-acyltransferase [Planctomycetaceae bacterium]|nr:apolipoprotein N-acyltransferase [Planctomycetaceae bacterium]
MNSPEPKNYATDSTFRFSPFLYGLLGNCLLYLCLPPIGWSWAAWLAPACWLPLIAVRKLNDQNATLKRAYFGLYITHVCCWLALLQGMRLAHWTTYFGWSALSIYLGLYLPLFVFAARTIHHQLKISLSYSAAISWVCVEWIRGYVISGFSMGSLSHSQVDHLWFIQTADLGGGFCISFVLVLGAGLLYRIWKQVTSKGQSSDLPIKKTALTLSPTSEGILFGMILLGCWTYGQNRLTELASVTTTEASLVSVGLIQGVTYTEFELSYDEYLKKEKEKQEMYNLQSIRALEDEIGLNLLVWPESMYPVGPLLVTGTNDEFLHVPTQQTEVSQNQDEVKAWADRLQTNQRQQHQGLLSYLNGRQNQNVLGQAMLIGGTSAVDLTIESTPMYNTAVLVSPEGEVLDMYHKNHLVMFGEYIPLGDVFPGLYNLLPISALAPGNGELLFDINGVKFCPNICFESTVPHRIRNMMLAADTDGRRPDVMLNLTNDGWFWGSSILDLHLRSNILRAVEFRRPNLVAANTGISGWIGPTGRLQGKVEKKEQGYLIAKVGRSSVDSFYLLYGDIFALICGLITLISLCKALFTRSTT